MNHGKMARFVAPLAPVVPSPVAAVPRVMFEAAVAAKPRSKAVAPVARVMVPAPVVASWTLPPMLPKVTRLNWLPKAREPAARLSVTAVVACPLMMREPPLSVTDCASVRRLAAASAA